MIDPSKERVLAYRLAKSLKKDQLKNVSGAGGGIPNLPTMLLTADPSAPDIIFDTP